MKFLFKTEATMKHYNNDDWWIDRDIIGNNVIIASDLKEAINVYCNRILENNYVSISKSAIKNKQPMYIDDKEGNPKQIGYVFTASTDFQNEDK